MGPGTALTHGSDPPPEWVPCICPHPVPQEPTFTYSSTVLPGGSLGAFLTNITLGDRENTTPQQGAPGTPSPAPPHPEGDSRQSSDPGQEYLLCGLRVGDKE